MEWLLFFLRLILSTVAALICSFICSVLAPLIASALIISSILHRNFDYIPPALGLLFLSPFVGFYIGFQHMYSLTDFLGPDDPEPPPIIRPFARHNPLLDQIDSLIHNKKTKLLTEDEIKQFETTIENQQNPKREQYKKLLEKYKLYTQDVCGITLEPISQIQDVVTIEGINYSRSGEKSWSKTYEKQAIRCWIETKGPHAKEPAIGCDLSKPYIRIYAGYPEWVCKFIALVKSILNPFAQLSKDHDPSMISQTMMPSRIITANHREAFYSGYPTLYSTTVTEAIMEDKHDSQIHYNNRFRI